MTQDNHRNHGGHADLSINDQTQSSKVDVTWQGTSNLEIKEIGKQIGKHSNQKLTQVVLEKLGEELGDVEARMDHGDYESAALRLNSFWDAYTRAAVDAEIRAKQKNKQTASHYGSRIDQAHSYSVYGQDLCKALKRLNNYRHKPGHEAWSDVDTDDPEFRTALRRVHDLTLAHYYHLEEHHV